MLRNINIRRGGKIKIQTEKSYDCFYNYSVNVLTKYGMNAKIFTDEFFDYNILQETGL